MHPVANARSTIQLISCLNLNKSEFHELTIIIPYYHSHNKRHINKRLFIDLHVDIKIISYSMH